MCLLPNNSLGLSNQRTSPSAFKIIAEYAPGLSPLKSWRTVITSERIGTQEYWPPYGRRSGKSTINSYKLSQQDEEDLLDRISETRFFDLRPTYSHRVTDNDLLVLQITMSGKTHRVAVYAPFPQAGKSAVQRFLTVWDEVLRKIPAPNESQLPGMYKTIR
jgi:hypothetical protein